MTETNNNENTNTTVNNLEVTFEGTTYRPIIRVADNGIWDIRDHEAMAAAVGPELYGDWLADFWFNLNHQAGRDFTTEPKGF